MPACDGKIRHFTRERAARYAVSLEMDTGDPNIAFYQCDFCGYWHVGHVLPETRTPGILSTSVPIPSRVRTATYEKDDENRRILTYADGFRYATAR